MNPIPQRVLAFDPSINHTGWALVRFERNGHNGEGVLIEDKGVVRPTGREGKARYGKLFREIGAVVARAGEVDLVVVEWPTFEESPRGRELVKKKGLTKLVAVAGGIVALVAAHGLPYALVTAWQWKGMALKPAIKKRVETLTGTQGTQWGREDEWEAAGLAIWAHRHPGRYHTYGADGSGLRESE